MRSFRLVIGILSVLSILAAGTTFAAEVAGPGDNRQVVGGLTNDLVDDLEKTNTEYYCNPETLKQHPVGIELADQFDVHYDEIMDLFCEGYGFGEIQIAYELSRATTITGVMPADLVQAYRDEGMGWGQIRQVLGLSNPENYLKFGEDKNGDPEEAFEGKTVREGPCPGEDQHPGGQQVADLYQEYGVTYEEVMTWFCAGYGFGEIKLAYSLALRNGDEITVNEITADEVAQIFGMRGKDLVVTNDLEGESTGMGWGQIKQELGVNGKLDDNNNGKDTDEDIDTDTEETKEQENKKDQKQKDSDPNENSRGQSKDKGGKP